MTAAGPGAAEHVPGDQTDLSTPALAQCGLTNGSQEQTHQWNSEDEPLNV